MQNGNTNNDHEGSECHLYFFSLYQRCTDFFPLQLYGPKRVFIPKMPALGLLLEEPLFDSYNERMATLNENLQPTDAEYRPAIDFDIHREKMNAFKEEYIYRNMREVEDRDGL